MADPDIGQEGGELGEAIGPSALALRLKVDAPLSRIAHALDLRMVLGFESTRSNGRPKRDLVTF
jgi:hypothetical protein